MEIINAIKGDYNYISESITIINRLIDKRWLVLLNKMYVDADICVRIELRVCIVQFRVENYVQKY